MKKEGEMIMIRSEFDLWEREKKSREGDDDMEE